MRFLFNKVTLSVGVLLILGTLGLGEFIFWRVLKVSCSNDQVIESKFSRIFEQAENRLHTQQALLAALLGGL